MNHAKHIVFYFSLQILPSVATWCSEDDVYGVLQLVKHFSVTNKFSTFVLSLNYSYYNSDLPIILVDVIFDNILALIDRDFKDSL